MSNRLKKAKIQEFDINVDVQGKEQPEVQRMVRGAVAQLLAQFDEWRHAGAHPYKFLSINGPTFANFSADVHGTGRPTLMRVGVSMSVLYEA